MHISRRLTTIKDVFRLFSRGAHQRQLRLAPSAKNMETVHYRYTPGDENFHLSFLYDDPQLNFRRQFNFTRRSDENVGSLLNRINTNLEKCVGKKAKKKKKDEAVVASAAILDVELLRNGAPLSPEAVCVDSIDDNTDIQLKINDKLLGVTVNAPWISLVTLPSSILAGFPVYPVKFEGFFLQKDKCAFEWFVGEPNTNQQHVKWQQKGSGYTYSPDSADIGKIVKLVCKPANECKTGPDVEAVSTVTVEAGPGVCPFENRHQFTKNRLSSDSLRVVSYNILADLYCDSDFSRTELFPYCPPYALNIDYRKQLFIKEILGYNGDIICLQEVDQKIFIGDLEPVMEMHSYNGIYTGKGGQVAEGISCFYRNDRFRFIEERKCVLGEQLENPIFKDIWNCIQQNEPYVNRFKPRTTTVQAVILESLDDSNEIILVGNTHLYFKPDADHIRVMQGGMTILWLYDIIEELQKKFPEKRISLILCGDFNSVPSCGVYKLYTTGYVPKDYIDWRSNEAEAVTTVSLNQPLLMDSACGTPVFTNFTVGFADCLDYIFYQKDNFEVLQVIPLPSIEEMSQHMALPSVVFPSDHVALIADLQLK